MELIGDIITVSLLAVAVFWAGKALFDSAAKKNRARYFKISLIMLVLAVFVSALVVLIIQ